LNAHGFNDVRQTETHTTEMTIEKLQGHRSPGIDQIVAELIKERG